VRVIDLDSKDPHRLLQRRPCFWRTLGVGFKSAPFCVLARQTFADFRESDKKDPSIGSRGPLDSGEHRETIRALASAGALFLCSP
jgi:hypothetical protein